MTGSTLNHSRRAVGSIIGGVFILLILVMGFTFFSLSNRGVSAQQHIFSEMQGYDIDRAQEKLEFSTLRWTPDSIEVKIVNRGPKLVNIIKIGLWNGESWNYYPNFLAGIDPDQLVLTNSELISSAGYKTFRLNQSTPLTSKTKLQFLTDKGMIFEVSYL